MLTAVLIAISLVLMISSQVLRLLIAYEIDPITEPELYSKYDLALTLSESGYTFFSGTSIIVGYMVV
jgi:hypothetical protein